MSPPTSPTSPKSPHGLGAKAVRAVIPVLLLAIGWISYARLSEEPEEEKRPDPGPRIIKTTVAEMELQDYQTIVRTRGIIRPHNEVALMAEVSGKIVAIHPGFEDGAFFSKDDILVEVDDADFQTSVLSAEAQLARAKATFVQEEARAKQAKLNWADLGYEEAPNELVLRLPQLREAQASVNAAEAQLDQAKRDLDRTRIRAPFDGRVRMRAVGIGQSVGPGRELGTIFATDYAEVRLPLSTDKLAFVDLPEDQNDEPVGVELRDALNEDSENVWRGEIVRTEGTLDENSLELFAIARISDPFGRSSKHPPLRIAQPVSAAIEGRVLEQVYVIPREAVRQVDRVYLVHKDGLVLDRQIITPVWSTMDHHVIHQPGLFDGAFLATSQLSYIPDEAQVEIIQPDTVADVSATESADQT